MRRAGKPAGLFASGDGNKHAPRPSSRASGDGGGHLATLPKAVIADIIALLDGPSVAKLGMTCRRMSDTTRPSGIWRALARAQEPHSSLVREDLVTRDFTWRHLYAWRRHVLRHCDGGVDRVAVADQKRVLTCDPVAGGGRSYVVHETPSPNTLVPSLLTWSPRGELLAVVQDAPEGCKVLLAAPPVTLRERNLFKRKEAPDDAFFHRAGGAERMGDEDSTAAGYCVNASAFEIENPDFSEDGESVEGGAGARGTLFPYENLGAKDDDDAGATRRRATANESRPLRRSVLRRKNVSRLASLNELTLPVSNPVFLAFAPCGTRLAVMSVQRRGREIALHELDCAVALFALYGNANAAVRNDRAHFSTEAREAVRLLKASRELSFCYGPRTRDVLALLDGARVARLAPKPLRAAPAEEEDTALLGLSAGEGRFRDDSPTTSVGTRPQVSGRGGVRRWLFPERARNAREEKAKSGAGGKRRRDAPGGFDNEFGPELEGDEREVSSAANSLWWRVTTDLAHDRYRAGAEKLSRGLSWCAAAVFGQSAGAGGSRGGRRRRDRPGPSLWPFGGDGRAIKRARLTHRRARGGQTDPSSRDDGRGSGGEMVMGCDGQTGPVPSRRRVRVEDPEPVTSADAETVAGAARHDALHDAQVEGLLHIVQWIKPAAPPPPGSGSDGKRKQAAPSPDPNPDGFWLVPASFADAVPPSTHLALLPARATPGPAELRGTSEERAEAKRRVMLGLDVPDRLAGALAGCSADFASRYDDAAAVAAAVAARDARRAFDASRLRSRVACELAPPTTYQELHAVVPVVASAAPGGGIVCWSDDVALWARRATGAERKFGVTNSAEKTKPMAVIDLQTCGFGADAVSSDASPPAHADAVGGNPVLHHVAAMQWSASGQRLLVLLVVHIATAAHVVAKYRWLVWDPPREWLEEEPGVDEDSDTVGVITMGRWHVPSASFTNDCLSIFEQYTQTNSMWNPNENAVAYPVRRDAAAGEDGVAADEIEIQHFPQTHLWRRPSRDDLNAIGIRQTLDPSRCLPFAVAPSPAPIVVCEGSFCAWSPR
jgi:hypothetical protein